jgi:threonine/homoserine efflux transporter RhtA
MRSDMARVVRLAALTALAVVAIMVGRWLADLLFDALPMWGLLAVWVALAALLVALVCRITRAETL